MTTNQPEDSRQWAIRLTVAFKASSCASVRGSSLNPLRSHCRCTQCLRRHKPGIVRQRPSLVSRNRSVCVRECEQNYTGQQGACARLSSDHSIRFSALSHHLRPQCDAATRAVDTSTVKESLFCRLLDVEYIETSAKTNHNVEAAFEQLTLAILDRLEGETPQKMWRRHFDCTELMLQPRHG